MLDPFLKSHLPAEDLVIVLHFLFLDLQDKLQLESLDPGDQRQ